MAIWSGIAHWFCGPRLYSSTCRVLITSKPFFLQAVESAAKKAFGSDESVRLQHVRGTTMFEVIAVAGSPEQASAKANAAAPKLSAAFSGTGPRSLDIIEMAVPGLSRRVPCAGVGHLVSACIGLIAGGIAAFLLCTRTPRNQNGTNL
jgi:hypothetical protein